MGTRGTLTELCFQSMPTRSAAPARSAAPLFGGGAPLTNLLVGDAATDESTGGQTASHLAAQSAHARTGTMRRIGIIIVAYGLMACTAAQAQAERSQDAASDQTWRVGSRPAMALTEGEVEGVDKEHSEVVINHGDLPNLGMGAMTMGFA